LDEQLGVDRDSLTARAGRDNFSEAFIGAAIARQWLKEQEDAASYRYRGGLQHDRSRRSCGVDDTED
jgi:hypothetical protein